MNKKKVFFLIGLPGSGKSTLTKFLSDSLGFSIISSNTILKEDSYLNGDYLKKVYVNQGVNIPDDLYIYLVRQCLQKSLNNKFIIEGFPYNLNQLKLAERMLSETSSELCGVIYLKVEEEILYNRLINRRVCLKCNQSFDNEVDLCPDCNQKTAKRDDDEFLIINKRIQSQKKELQVVLDYYMNNNKLIEFDNSGFEKKDKKIYKLFNLR